MNDAESASPSRRRAIYCNRTLNLRSIRAIGYDMDYTLIHYQVDEWERCAYDHVRRKMEDLGWPVGHLSFDPDLVTRGLIVDIDRGNIVKANRYGYVKRVAHGTRRLTYEEQRKEYARTLVSLKADSFVFLNTLFSLSEASLFSQLVDIHDADGLEGVMSYRDIYRAVRQNLDEAHMEGQLKADILADPERYVVLDPETPLALLDQKHAGKKLLLITNSEYPYTRAIMTYAFDRFLPHDMTWRDLFDIVIVSARKPTFFQSRQHVFEVVNDEGLLRPARTLEDGKTFLGGHAGLVEDHLGIKGDRILYVGDHIYGDARVSKSMLRWRTALVVRELEEEIVAIEAFQPTQAKLAQLMARKEELESRFSRLRLELQRNRINYGPTTNTAANELESGMTALRSELVELDAEIAVLAREASGLFNSRWGLLMRSGNDKSHLARQIERYTDIYTSRVSNFLHETPFAYFRSYRGSLPHDGQIKLNPLDS